MYIFDKEERESCDRTAIMACTCEDGWRRLEIRDEFERAYLLAWRWELVLGFVTLLLFFSAS